MILPRRTSAIVLLLVGLATAACVAGGRTAEWSWERWSRALLDGTPPTQLPPIPAAGWTAAAASGWTRDSAQVADYDDDGVVDYIRIQDPPGSYNHVVWIDRDRDGVFDTYPGSSSTGERDPRYRVPRFALLRPLR